MKNKLGLNFKELEKVEKTLIKTKLELINEFFTFNLEVVNYDLLKKINLFLIDDIYFCDDKKMDDKFIKNINDLLNRFLVSASYKLNDEMLLITEKLWSMQIFEEANTRTLIAFLKIMNNAYDLNLNIDLNKKFNSGTTYFKNIFEVNQNRLTK